VLSDLIYRLRAIFRRADVERELEDELHLHVEQEAAKYERAGMRPDDARRRARLALGGYEQVKEECRDVRGTRWLEELAQDLRYGARQLRHSPGFALVAILSLALGIGANTAIFQLLNAVRLRSLPVPRPHELAQVRIAGGNQGMGINPGQYEGLTRPIWEEIRREHPAFSGVFAWIPDGVYLGPRSDLQRANGLTVSGEFFETLGVQPWRGRILTRADDAVSCPSTVGVISHAYWQGAMGGREIGDGTTLLVNGEPKQIVGVMPPTFPGLVVGEQFDIAQPFCRPKELRSEVFSVIVMGRLRPGWTSARASRQLDAASPAIFEATAPTGYGGDTVERFKRFRLEAISASSGVSWLRSTYDSSLWLLLGITGLVLLIACANLANLLLAKASTRERELAVRLALGASRGRLLRQLIAESGLLAVIGGALGLAVAQSLSRVLVLSISTEGSAVTLPMETDWRVLLFAAAVAMSTCVVFGLVPALRATGAHPVEAMKSGGRGLSGSRERTTIHRLLVVTQIAVSLVLLAGALLFVRSFHNLTTLDPGMRQRGIIDALVAVPGLQGPAERYEALLRQVLDEMRAIPGISGVATTSNVPLLGSSWTHGIRIGTTEGLSKFAWVSTGYFRTMGIPLLAGRDIDETDTSASRRVAVVNQMFVRTFLGGNDPIGRTLTTSPEPHYPATDYEIVGVIADTKYHAIREGTPPMAFAPAWQHPQLGPGAMFMIHSSLAPDVTMAAIKRTIAAKHPDAILEMKVFETQIRDGMLRERLMAMLSGFFGVLAALLAMIGLYGLISYLVARRQNEIGIRLALGARPREIVRTILRDAGRLLIVGLSIGVALVLLAGRSASSSALLFGLTPYDPPTLVAACLLLAAIAGLASLLPARRAARTDPLVALRHE
jgi:predicted permease